MTAAEALQLASKRFMEAGISSNRLDGQILLEEATGKKREYWLAHPHERLSREASDIFTRLVERRAKREPLVHLTGRRQFFGLELIITKDVLTPRVESEKIVELAIRHTPKEGRLLDMGTGSGALAIAIGRHRPDLDITATDVTEEALAVARKNAKRHNVDIDLVPSDLWQAVSGQFDCVVANLPYLPDDSELMPEVQKEPTIALFGGHDGLELYRRFFEELPNHLAPKGYVFLECDPWQHAAVTELAAGVGLRRMPMEDYFISAFRLD